MTLYRPSASRVFNASLLAMVAVISVGGGLNRYISMKDRREEASGYRTAMIARFESGREVAITEYPAPGDFQGIDCPGVARPEVYKPHTLWEPEKARWQSKR